MTQRTSRATFRFRHGFTLRAIARRLPPGLYTVETTEEHVDVFFPFDVHRRVATTLFLPAGAIDAEVEQFVIVDPMELAEALQRDGR